MHAEARTPVAEGQDAGIYNWDIAADIVQGDAAVALLFGLGQQAVRKGLPLASYVERIHPDDRAGLIDALKLAILTRGSFQAQYRVQTAERICSEVVAFGHCFFEQDEPKSMTGIVHPLPPASGGFDGVSHLIAAHTFFARNGADSEAAMVRDLLKRLVVPVRSPRTFSEPRAHV